MNEQQLIDRIQALEDRLRLLENTTTIPLEVDTAFRDRLGIDDKTSLSGSTKNVSDVTQAVAESGSASYSVAKVPDGFYQTDTGTHIPYYNT